MSPTAVGVWPPLPPGVYGRTPRTDLPFPLGRRTSSVFARARHALWQGVQALELGPGDEVLVPAYHHGSEVEALLRAGLELRFYDGGPRLEPDADELERLLGPRTRALYLIHYLGFPQATARWRTWCDERSLLLLEDAGQAWLASDDDGPVGTLGDLAIFCLYKTFGVPDGGALNLGRRPPGPETRVPRGLGGVARRHALWTLQRSRSLAALADRGRGGGRGYAAAEDFALGDPASAPAAATHVLLPRIADEEAAARRRANYETLLEALADRVRPPFDAPPAGASPFAFPLEADDKGRLLDHLAERGIRALDFWSIPHPALMADAYPGAQTRRGRTIGLPVHQELRVTDVEAIVRAARGRRPRVPELNLEPVDALETIADEWRELAARGDNIFSTWEWASVWSRHFRPRGPLALTACRARDGRLVAILPLYLFTRAGIRIARFIGHGPADQLGAVCAPEDRPRARRALRRLLADIRADLFLGEQVPADEGWPAALGGRSLRRDGSPVLRFAGLDWDALLATRSANLRQQVRRFERRLERDHDVHYRLADDPARLDDDLDLLFELHAARWSNGPSAFLGAHGAFQREFARLAFERGWMRLWILEVDGTPVSAWYGFRFAGTESYYQAGRDPAWEDASVGFVLLAHSVRAALADGMREYRFLRGGESFKYRFANADPGLETVGVARGLVAEAALAASDALPAPVDLTVRRWLAHAGVTRG